MPSKLADDLTGVKNGLSVFLPHKPPPKEEEEEGIVGCPNPLCILLLWGKGEGPTTEGLPPKVKADVVVVGGPVE